jgi:hypothetical protein
VNFKEYRTKSPYCCGAVVFAVERFVGVVAAVVFLVAELRLVDAHVVVQAQELVRRTLKQSNFIVSSQLHYLKVE